MSAASVTKIAVFGNGLAGMLCVAKLINILPNTVELTFIEAEEPSNIDIFFGTVAPPSTYDFLLALGISEPDLLPQTHTSFSLGTKYEDWGGNQLSWTQGFYRPLPAYNGVAFHHYLTRLRPSSPEISEIEPYIMSVQAAERGVFAHPPEGKKIPLADVEYGYHFLPEQWCEILKEKISASAVKQVRSDITKVLRHGDSIQSVALSNGKNIEADFIINALGPQSPLAYTKDKPGSGRSIKAISSQTLSEPVSGARRVVSGRDFGWQSKTPLQNGIHQLTVYAPEVESDVLAQHGNSDLAPIGLKLGRLSNPWTGNCLALGHSAACVEPLTPAPILLLQRDIEKLVELLPRTETMTIESREYNRRFNSDYEHAELFSRAFFETKENENSAYWNAASSDSLPQKLQSKIDQFKSRGIPVQYDYEPFSAEDWTLLHLGMRRRPTRYDPLADHLPEQQLRSQLGQMRDALQIMAKKMPPHHVYMAGLLKYLKDKHG